MKDRNTLIALILLSLVALALVAILAYEMYAIKSKNDQTTALLQQADKVAHEDLEFQSIRSVLEAIKSDVDTFNGVVLTESGVVPMIEKVEAAGRRLGLETKTASISLAKPDSSASAGNAKRIKITIETKGGKVATRTFLKALESLPTQIMIEESSIHQEEDVWRSRTSFEVYAF